MSENFEPRIVGFLCNWCSYAGADLAGTSRTSYPPNIRIIRVPCSGRVDPLFVVKSFEQGADGVMVLGCHPGDCHYSDGNYYARRRYVMMINLLDFVGISSERTHVDWVSASEGARFASVVGKFTEKIKKMGPLHRWESMDGNDAGYLLDPDVLKVKPPSFEVEDAEGKLRDAAARLLEDGKVEAVLGWENGPVRVRPFVARTPQDARRLVYGEECAQNLSTFLPRHKGKKVGIVVRPDDLRSINILTYEKQIDRQNVLVIGINQPQADVNVQVNGGEYRDTILDEKLVKAVRELETMTVEQRRAFWEKQFEKCLRCYACRQACPLCYCSECVAEQLAPPWQTIAINTREKAFFHVMRAYHLAGRCVGCGACQNACPVGVPLNLLNAKLALEVERLFPGYRAGADSETPPVLQTFLKEEKLGIV